MADLVHGKTALQGYIPVLSCEHQAERDSAMKQREESPAMYMPSIMHFHL